MTTAKTTDIAPVGATRLLASFVAAVPSVVQPHDRAVLQRSLGEWICAALSRRDGAQPEELTAFRATVDLGGDVPCVGGGAASAPLAAWANGAMTATSPLADSDDLGADGAIVWSALAAASTETPSVDRLIDAAGHGIRAAHALSRAGRYRRAERGFDQRGVFGLLAAAMACSRLRGHDVVTTLETVSVAASFTGGLLAARHSLAGVLVAADAARDGLLATLLAEHGVSGAPDMLEGRQGFGEAFFGLGASDLDRLSSELEAARPIGDSLRALSFGGHIDHQRPLSALLALREAALVGDGERVIVDGVPPTSEGNRVSTPRSPDEARHSLRYVLATAWEQGSVGSADFGREAIAARVQSGALDRIEVRSAPRWNRAIESPHSDAESVTVRRSSGDRSVLLTGGFPLTASASQLALKWHAEASRNELMNTHSASILEGLWPIGADSVSVDFLAEGLTAALGIDSN